MLNFFRILFYSFILKPIVYFCLGLNVKNAQYLPKKGPCIIISNHNSHLDTIVLMSLFSGQTMLKISPVAAADYFLRNKVLAWISLNFFNIIPINRKVSKSEQEKFYENLGQRLQDNSIIILYPEGSRGEPEQLANFKTGIAHIAKLYPDTPIIPIYMDGLGMALPRGEAIFVPTLCKVNVSMPIFWNNDKDLFMEDLKNIYQQMKDEIEKEKI